MGQQQPDTSQRLLDAAERLFADTGYDAVSVREIAAAAAVNVAAINYHFGGKAALYDAVLARVMARKRDRYLAVLRTAGAPEYRSLEDLLAAFFANHLEDTLMSDHGRAFIKLFVREVHLGDPRRLRLIHEALAPLWTELRDALIRFVPELGERNCALAVGSLHGQLVHFTMRWHARANAALQPGAADFIQAVFPPLADTIETYIEQTVAHITRFSAAGIRALGPDEPDARTLRKEAT